MEREAEAIYFLDLSECEPAKALSRNSRPGTWTMVDYEIEQGQGVMLFAGSLTDFPSVTLKLNVTGWYGIYLGIYYKAGAEGLAFWDSFGRYLRASEWAFVKKLGHKDDLPAWRGHGDDYYRVVPMLSLDGQQMGREFSLPTDG